jgi:hypothetical protein
VKITKAELEKEREALREELRQEMRDELREEIHAEISRSGGVATAAKLTAKQRTERARKAGLAGGRGRTKKGGKR